MSQDNNFDNQYFNDNSDNSTNSNIQQNDVNRTPESQKETIIKFHMDEIVDENIKKNTRQFNISPIIRRTPNTKADLIIHKIYSNRKNVIKCFQNTKRDSLYNLNNINNTNYDITSYISPKNIQNIPELKKDSKKYILNNSIKNNDTDNSNLYNYETENVLNHLNMTPSVKKNNSSDTSPEGESSPDNSTTPLSENSLGCENDIRFDKKKRKYYRTFKMKKLPNIKNSDSIQSPKSTPESSPRDISEDLWNDSVENYHLEFQKLCKEESQRYKYLSHRNEMISNFLKFILLISGCFTFTLSISIPNSLFMSTTTTISSCLTAIITSVTGFFQFDKKSEIQYNIYRELDKLYNTISLELLKPSYMRTDPYEFILSLRNRRDELLKTLQKNR